VRLVKILRFLVLFVVTVCLGGAALGGSLVLLGPAGAQLDDISTFEPIDPVEITASQTSYMFDRNGGLMTPLFEDENRVPVPLDRISQHLVDAVIAIEDRKFYEHSGIDLNGILRALRENVDAGGVTQGGSTITQQLVKVTQSDLYDRTLKNKIREAFLAHRLEDALDKDEILELYLNIVYFGNSAYGAEAAADRYWSKHASELTLAEAALLAGLIQSPATLDPINHPDRAARRRALVLDAMVDMGTITRDEADAANLEPLPTEIVETVKRRDFFTTEVIDRLLNDDPTVDGDVAEVLGGDETERYNAVFRGGLRIHTTYDPLAQFIAASAVLQELPESEVVAAVVIVENETMAVRAMMPGYDFATEQFNPITTKGRPTGSTFKVITMLTALAAGYSPRDRVDAGGISIDLGPGQEPWTPRNCGGGTDTLTDAIVGSHNCAFARIIASLGPGHFAQDGAHRVVEMAGRLGIDTSRLDPVPSLTLGPSDTNMLDMAEAFAVMPNDGIHKPPIFVTKIEGPDGEVVYEADNDGERVLEPEVARTAVSMLEGVIQRGTGRAANIGRPAAGKTGTTNENSNAWFVGFTPQYTTAVWMGHPDENRSMTQYGISNAQGGTYPARIWSAVMEPLHRDLPELDFVAPDERQWPTAQRIRETGREFTRDFVGEDATTTTTVADDGATTTVPTDATPTTPPVAPPAPPPAAPPPTAAAPPPSQGAVPNPNGP